MLSLLSPSNPIPSLLSVAGACFLPNTSAQASAHKMNGTTMASPHRSTHISQVPFAGKGFGKRKLNIEKGGYFCVIIKRCSILCKICFLADAKSVKRCSCILSVTGEYRKAFLIYALPPRCLSHPLPSSLLILSSSPSQLCGHCGPSSLGGLNWSCTVARGPSG